MKKYIFRRIFISYFFVLLASTVFIELYITNVVRTHFIENLTDSLSKQALLISDTIPFISGLDEKCRQLKEKTGARVTIIDSKGRVLGDSDSNSDLMENHLDRTEVQRSVISGTGSSIRYSNTLKYDLLYVSRQIVRDGEDKGFVRLSVPLREVNSSINSLRLKINLIIILLFIFAGLIIVWQTERLRKFVNQITEYSGALAHGLFHKRLRIEGAMEFSEIAESLNKMASDLSESITKRDEEANRLNVILRSIPDALLLIDPSGNIDLSNNAANLLFGTHELKGRPFVEVVRSPDFLQLVNKVKDSHRPASAEIVIDISKETHLSVSASPLFYKEGELAGIVAIFHDTTDLKKLEQVRKDFVANVSHEIKTPVTAIRGYADALLDGALEEKENSRRFIRTIRAHGERLGRLVDDLLTLSKLELGVIKIIKSEVDIQKIIDSVIDTLKINAEAKGLALKKSVGENIFINADRDRLEQILLNLVHNAVKFTEKGYVEIGIADEDGQNYIFVKDTGAGIANKYLPRLGERFFRVDPSRSRELGGTGLGLAIVKHIVKAHGWEMKIESVFGKGTIVKVFY
jgi:two-component system phosphate regulon sensor histidine kinase PhoR